MMELLKQLPHIEPYGNPQYFFVRNYGYLANLYRTFFSKNVLPGMKYWLVCSLSLLC